ncbi:MAG: lysophospholipid acyltransferase family protein [Candidatus Portnoybacteria bacterium]|nr:lysophospholipid acyltransferase family protein [Candidatus Portnoybacteria bacterium]
MSEKGKILNIVQKIGWIILRPFFLFFAHFKYETEIDLNSLKRPIIIVANHETFIDTLLIGDALPFSCPIFPIYFIAADEYIKTPGLGSLMKLFGAFPACKGQGMEKSLEMPKKVLASGCSVFFFPQGRRCANFELEQGKPGAAILALQTNKIILPVAICGLSNFSWKGFFLRRHRVRIRIGKPFLLKDKLDEIYCPGNFEVGTQIIMEEIKKLLKDH